MSCSLGELLERWPLPPALAAAGWREAAGQLEGSLGASLSWVALECALIGPTRVDVSVCLTAETMRAFSPIWLEFDHARPPPLLFGTIRGQWDRLGQFLALQGLPDFYVPLLRWMGDLPPTISILHAASLAPRGERALRLVLTVPRDGLSRLLSELWVGTFPAEMLEEMGDFHSHLNLGIDWKPDRLSERIGLEVFHPGTPAQDQRWKPVFEMMRRLGVAEERAAALMDWGTPSGAMPERMLQIKLGQQRGGPVIPKAYLAIRASGFQRP